MLVTDFNNCWTSSLALLEKKFQVYQVSEQVPGSLPVENHHGGDHQAGPQQVRHLEAELCVGKPVIH